MSRFNVLILLFGVIFVTINCQDMPAPFTRQLYYTTPEMHGNDVIILQNLLVRSSYVKFFNATGTFDKTTEAAVENFQSGNNLGVDGIFGPSSANLLLSLHSCDGYSDAGLPASYYGEQYLYKFSLQFFRNRSLETKGFLYDRNNTLIYQFIVRGHGHDSADASQPWPSWSSTIGLNQFTSDGNTPTGLFETDLNSPEDDAQEYSPFPINRILGGFEGNGAFLMPAKNPIRSGILLHSGEWRPYGFESTYNDMPNSDGCVHTHLDMLYTIWKKLVGLGVVVRQNPGGVQPYPYQPQGIFSVEQVNCQ